MPTRPTGERCGNTRMFRHSPWLGSAFSSACSGESWFPNQNWQRAEHWYRKAIDCLPGYVKARVHLAEIYSADGRTSDAEAILAPAIASGDPEVHWRLADVMAAQGRHAEAEAAYGDRPSPGSRRLLERHPLAFADHGAEFYAGSGNDAPRAPSSWHASTSQTARRCAPSSRRMRSPCARGMRLPHPNCSKGHAKRWGGTAAFGLSLRWPQTSHGRSSRVMIDRPGDLHGCGRRSFLVGAIASSRSAFAATAAVRDRHACSGRTGS